MPASAAMCASISGKPILNQLELTRPDERVFDEPWQATAFAMVVKLHEGGLFAWSEWAETLGAEISADRDRPYYESWLAALERILAAKGVAGAAELGALKDAWRDAYIHTPHGKPVRLRQADGGPIPGLQTA